MHIRTQAAATREAVEAHALDPETGDWLEGLTPKDHDEHKIIWACDTASLVWRCGELTYSERLADNPYGELYFAILGLLNGPQHKALLSRREAGV